MRIHLEHAATWFENRAAQTPKMENPVVTYWMPVPDRPDEPKEA